MFFAAAEAQTYRRRVVELRFFSPCFEYQDLFVSNRIVYPSESYLSQKVMSEVSVSRRRRSPSARSDFAEGGADAEGADAPLLSTSEPAGLVHLVVCVCFLRPPRPKHHIVVL